MVEVEKSPGPPSLGAVMGEESRGNSWLEVEPPRRPPPIGDYAEMEQLLFQVGTQGSRDCSREWQQDWTHPGWVQVLGGLQEWTDTWVRSAHGAM
jgi:hypothetical protein